MLESTRICVATGCSNTLPPNAYRNKRFCSRKCVSAEHNRVNADRARELKRRWNEANREAISAANAKKYAERRDEILAWHRAHYADNRDRIKAESSAYFWANREHVLEQQRRRRLSGEPAAAVRARRKARPESFRAKEERRRAREANAYTVEFSTEALRQRLAYFGNACWMCRGPYEALDHVKPLSKHGPHMLANIRPSCRSCNSRKRDRWHGPRELHQFKATA